MWWSAFLIGFLGSFHCVAMCGPLAMMVQGIGSLKTAGNRLLYHAGKIATYIFLGIVIFRIGAIFQLQNYQNTLSIAVGASMILLVCFPLTKINTAFLLQWIIGYLRYFLAQWMNNKSPFSSLIKGVLNGFLPCGLVYTALIVAAIQPSLGKSISYMLYFGLGTFPMLFFASYSLRWVTQKINLSLNAIQNGMLVFIGVYLILRGVYFAFHSGPMPEHGIPFCL